MMLPDSSSFLRLAAGISAALLLPRACPHSAMKEKPTKLTKQ